MKKLILAMLCGVAVAAASYWAWNVRLPDPAGSVPATGPMLQPQAAAAARRPASSSDGAPVTRQVLTDHARIAPDCTIVRHYVLNADGTVTEPVSCERNNVPEPHPYVHYPSAALESLAYSDAKAAEVLGMRLIEDDEAASLSLVVRAAALYGGDPAPIRQYASAYPHPVAVDGVPQREAVRVKFVLAAVAALLNEDPGVPNAWEPTIRQHSAEPDREIALLHARAAEIVAEMRRIELDVLGTSTIGGPGDA